jgi:hypothetical protein
MGKAHQMQKKIAQPKSGTNELATRKINTINRKLTPPIQSVPKGCDTLQIKRHEKLAQEYS